MRFWLGVAAGVAAAWGAFSILMWGEAHYYRKHAAAPGEQKSSVYDIYDEIASGPAD